MVTVSVVIPALDEIAFIGQCLESLTKQTVPPDEIIIVDAGSTDGTVEVARQYANNVFRIYKSSISLGRDYGTREAKGEIIVSTDADTVFSSDYIERVTSHFQDPNVVAVGGAIYPLNPSAITNLYTSSLNAISNGLHWFMGSNMAFRKDAYLKAGGYPVVHQSEDWILSANLSKQGKTVYDPEAIVWTDVPLNRQLEFAAVAGNAGLLGAGLGLDKSFLSGIGAGFLGTEFVMAVIANYPAEWLHHSQLAAAGLVLLLFGKGYLKPKVAEFLCGVLDGIMVQHIVTEDVNNPPWLAVNGSFTLGISLLFLAI